MSDTNWDFRRDALDAEECEQKRIAEYNRRLERLFALKCSAALLDGAGPRLRHTLNNCGEPFQVCTGCNDPNVNVRPGGLCHKCEQSVRDTEDDCRG